MHILLTDETNMPSDPGAKFFVYGGLFFPVEKLVALDERIELIRNETGYKPGDELKFETNARPIEVTIEVPPAPVDRAAPAPAILPPAG